MPFCWFTSSIGYPDFFATSGNPAELAQSFLELGHAAKSGLSYEKSKKLFEELNPHQVETKKAAFQEFGLLYVVPRSDVLSLTPLGEQVLSFCSKNRRSKVAQKDLLVALIWGLSRYQFSNPLPVGGNSADYRARAASTDVRPYLAGYWLLHRLNGILTASELRGAVFALKHMRDLPAAAKTIARARENRQMLSPHPGMPERHGTAENLKIYFMAHLGAANHVVRAQSRDIVYKANDQVYELTRIGRDVTQLILNNQWPNWKSAQITPPVAVRFQTVDEYFQRGVGAACPKELIAEDSASGDYEVEKIFEAEVGADAAELLKELPTREYDEGRTKLVNHVRIERSRSAALVKDAKKAHKALHGRLFCEACGFEFEGRYGKRGRDYIEAHHRVPISKLDTTKLTKITRKDLALVCANCHRMLHRTPWISVEELRAVLSSLS